MSYRDELKSLRYGDQIAQMFDAIYEDWMSESDREEYVRDVLLQAGITLSHMDELIQIGVNNGVSADDQIRFMIDAMQVFKQPTMPETAKDKE